MTGIIKTLPALLIVVAPPLIAGVRDHPLLGSVWAAAFVLLAVITMINEPPHYDMHHFGLALYGGAAVAASVALGVGLVVRRLRAARTT